jgi:CRISPR-associated protein Cmr4
MSLLFPLASQVVAAVDHVPDGVAAKPASRSSPEPSDLSEQQVSFTVMRMGKRLSFEPRLALPAVKTDWPPLSKIAQKIEALGIPGYIIRRLGIVSDKLFTHIVNSNLEVRTSVAIDPATGAAEEGALFTYEALPRGTVLFWELTCRNPKHFKIAQDEVKAVASPEAVSGVLTDAHPYLEHLGIGGMGSRGMGRLRVLTKENSADADKPGKEVF